MENMEKKRKFNIDKIWKVLKKNKLNSEKIWQIWKKSKLNNENTLYMENTAEKSVE
jgi:hypothetical protein